MIEFVIDLGSGFKGNDPNLFKGLDGDPNVVFRRELDQSAAAILNRLRTTYLAEQDPTGKPWVPSKAAMRRRSSGGRSRVPTGGGGGRICTRS